MVVTFFVYAETIMCLIVLLYYTISIFIPDISIYVLYSSWDYVLCINFPFCYLVTHIILSCLFSWFYNFFTHMFVLHVLLFLKFSNTLYFYLQYFSQYLLSNTMLFLPLLVILSVECSQLLYTILYVDPWHNNLCNSTLCLFI